MILSVIGLILYLSYMVCFKAVLWLKSRPALLIMKGVTHECEVSYPEPDSNSSYLF